MYCTGRFRKFPEALHHPKEDQYLALEENLILPLARKFLTREDWSAIAAAFDEDKIPSLDNVADELFKVMLDASPAPGPAAEAAEPAIQS